MIIEYYTSEGVLYADEADPRTLTVIPRKNEVVFLHGKEFTVKSISHSPIWCGRKMGQDYITHKVFVELM